MDRPLIPIRFTVFHADRFGEHFAANASPDEPVDNLGASFRDRVRNRDVLVVFNGDQIVARCKGVDTRVAREIDGPCGTFWLSDNAEKLAQPGAKIHILDD